MTEEALSDPDWFRNDMERWTTVLSAVGIDLTPEQLQHGVRGIAWRYRGAVAKMRDPFAPFFRAIKANQQWGLFGAVTEIPDRLVIEADRGGGFEPVFVKLHPEHDWREPLWRYRRVRGIWDSVKKGDKPKGTYRRLSMWTARQLFMEDPSIERVRFKLERLHLTAPWEPVNPEIEVRGERVHKRDGFRFYSQVVPPVPGTPGEASP